MKNERDVLAEKMTVLIGKVIESCIPGSQAYRWAMELATAMNQSDPCLRCDGKGYRPKCRNCHHGQEQAWINECDKPIPCKQCHGTGRVSRHTVQSCARQSSEPALLGATDQTAPAHCGSTSPSARRSPQRTQ